MKVGEGADLRRKRESAIAEPESRLRGGEGTDLIGSHISLVAQSLKSPLAHDKMSLNVQRTKSLEQANGDQGACRAGDGDDDAFPAIFIAQ
jgi:hypothetical protein